MKRTIYLLVCTLLSVQLFAQEKSIQSFSLQQAVEYAKKNNLALKNGQLDISSSEKKVKEILASGLPQVNAGANYTHNITIPSMALPDFISPAIYGSLIQYGLISPSTPAPPVGVFPAQFGAKYSAAGSITASQLLFDGGFLMGVKASREYVQLAKVNQNRNSIETEVNVSKAYYGALSLKTNLELIDRNLQTLKQAVSESEAAYKVGLLDKTSFDRASIQYSNLNLQKLRTQDGYIITMMVLKLQMGMNVNDSITLSDDLQTMYTKTQTALVETKLDYSKRAEYQLLEQSISLNTLDKKRYQYGYAPSLSISATHQQNSFGQSFSELGKTWYPGTFWGLNLQVPIFDGLRKSAQIQQSKIAIQKLENDRKNFENAMEQQVAQARLKYSRSAEQVEIQRKNLELAEDVYKNTQVKLKNGVGSSIELATSLADLETARVNFLTTINDYFVAQLELRQATGDIK
ncbi:MAG: TolC family protein [Bacteroidota bacterium]